MYVVDTTPDATRSRRVGSNARLCPDIPILVDNLWEWKRPEDLPSRRTSTVASPTPELALQRVGGADADAVRRVSLPVGVRVAQLTARGGASHDPSDAKFHPDVIGLPALLRAELGPDWEKGSLSSKARAGLLWVPCLAKDEVEMLFQRVSELAPLREKIWNAIRFWNYVELLEMLIRRPDPRGELFFDSPNGYWLEPVSQQMQAAEEPAPSKQRGGRLFTRLLARA